MIVAYKKISKNFGTYSELSATFLNCLVSWKNLISKCIPSLLLTYFWATYFLPSIWTWSRVQNISLSLFPKLKAVPNVWTPLKKEKFSWTSNQFTNPELRNNDLRNGTHSTTNVFQLWIITAKYCLYNWYNTFFKHQNKNTNVNNSYRTLKPPPQNGPSEFEEPNIRNTALFKIEIGVCCAPNHMTYSISLTNLCPSWKQSCLLCTQIAFLHHSSLSLLLKYRVSEVRVYAWFISIDQHTLYGES